MSGSSTRPSKRAISQARQPQGRQPQGRQPQRGQAKSRQETRQAQIERRRLERQREAALRRRNELIRRASLWGGGLLVGVLLLVLLVRALTAGGVEQLKLASGHPATGQSVDGISCAAMMTSGQHFHVYLAIYADGQQMQVPPLTGILTSCMYALHVHQGQGMDNIIHVESPDKNATYTLGQFFDIWGQPLSRTQALGYTASAAHPLNYVVLDESGKATTVTGDPRGIVLQPHETVAILYNSPKVTPTPNPDWNGM